MGSTAERTQPEFKPLEGRQTRIVEQIDDLHNGEQICFYLKVIEIPEPESAGGMAFDYTALSYTWEDITVQVTVVDEDNNEYTIEITENLLKAIQHVDRALYKYWAPRTEIWADQLCIDQTNIADKERQIPIMVDIYRNARTVIIWLGEENEDSDLAMQTIDDLFEIYTERQDQAWNPEAMLPLLGCDDSRATLVKRWTAVRKLCQRKWFTRSWVLQEAFAKPIGSLKVHILCGTSVTELSAFFVISWLISEITSLGTIKQLPFLPTVISSTLQRMINICFTVSSPYRPTQLIGLLEESREFGISDHRDKIYSMLSFASDHDPFVVELPITYSSSVSQTYTNFALWHLQCHQNLDFLSRCGPHSLRNDTALPCWVPDWRTAGPKAPIPVFADAHDSTSEVLFSADEGIGLPNLTSTSFAYDETPPMLTLSGFRIGTITALSSPLDWLNTPSYAPSYLMEIYARTLCMDLDYDETERGGFFRRGAYIRYIHLKDEVAFPSEVDDSYQHPDLDSRNQNARGMTQERLDQAHTEEKLTICDPFTHIKQTTGFRISGRKLFTFKPVPELALQDHSIVPEAQLEDPSCKKLLGLGPSDLRDGDELFMLRGGKALYVLRPWTVCEEDGHVVLHCDASEARRTNGTGEGRKDEHELKKGDLVHEFIGDAVALPLMDGQIADGLKETGSTLKTVHLMSPPIDRRVNNDEISSQIDDSGGAWQHRLWSMIPPGGLSENALRQNVIDLDLTVLNAASTVPPNQPDIVQAEVEK